MACEIPLRKLPDAQLSLFSAVPGPTRAASKPTDSQQPGPPFGRGQERAPGPTRPLTAREDQQRSVRAGSGTPKGMETPQEAAAAPAAQPPAAETAESG